MYVLNDYIRILTTQSNRVLDISIDLVDRNFIPIDTLEGVVIGGNITLNADNKIRRQCNVEMVVKESKYGVGFDKTIWLNKYIKIVIKVFDNLTQEYIPFDFGYFALNNSSVKYDATNHNLSFTGMDLMCKLSKEFGNQLRERIKIEANAPLSGFIRAILSVYGKFPEDRMMINTDKLMPYKKEWKPENDVLDVLNEVIELYMNYEMYISEDGVFYYQQIPKRDNDPIWVDFTEMKKDLTLSIDEKYDFENVKNVIIVNGKLKEDSSQPSYTIKNEDNRSPFSIQNLGEERVLVYNDDKYYTIEQCQMCAEYQYYLHNDLNEVINVSCVPIYYLDVNKKVRLYNEKLGLDKICLCTSVNIPLTVEDAMSFECIELRSKV